MRLISSARFAAPLAIPLVLAALVAGCDSGGSGSPFPNLRPQGTWDRRDSLAVATSSGTQYVVFDQALVLDGASSALTGTLTTRRIDSRPITPPRALENATVKGTFDGFAVGLDLTYPSRTARWNGSVAISNDLLGFTTDENRQVSFLRRGTLTPPTGGK